MAKNPAPRLKEALALRQQGRHDQAEAVLRKILATQPGHADALYQLALLKADAGALSEAHYFATSALAAARSVKPNSAARSDTTSMTNAHFSNDMTLFPR